MAKISRKDTKGYVLHTGESQRKADGRYCYSYTDRQGDRHYIYASTLVELRKKEKELDKSWMDGLDPFAAEKMTVNDMFDRYMSQKFDLKPTTKSNYLYTYDHIVRDGFGKRRLSSIKYTDVKKYYNELLTERGLSPATVDNIHTLLHPAFQLAIREEILRMNPSDGVMAEIKKSKIWVKNKRHALTIPQQKAFMNFIEENPEFSGWYPIVTVLLGTGMRIGECLGLRWDDLDFDKRLISVTHTLSDRPIGKEHKCERHIMEPKTEAGTRIIPMLDEVMDAFLQEYQIQKCLGFCTEEIDGYSGFVFSTAQGKLYQASAVNQALHRMQKAYNDMEGKRAKAEKREPELIPSFSAHNLRHTFCTRFCENETNIKVIQEVMGHKDVQTTLDIYAESTTEKKQEVINSLQGKIIIK
jgi:integrase